MNLKSLTQPELAAIFKELGQPAFRAKQVYTWLHKGVRSYDEMTNQPKGQLCPQGDAGLPGSHIVLMGIGEPLDNFDNVMRFLELVNSEEGMNISMRHISLSTCGLVPKIDELAKRKLQLTLSVSLHAPNDTIRNQIMPVNKAYPSEELLEACRR